MSTDAFSRGLVVRHKLTGIKAHVLGKQIIDGRVARVHVQPYPHPVTGKARRDTHWDPANIEAIEVTPKGARDAD